MAAVRFTSFCLWATIVTIGFLKPTLSQYISMQRPGTRQFSMCFYIYLKYDNYVNAIGTATYYSSISHVAEIGFRAWSTPAGASIYFGNSNETDLPLPLPSDQWTHVCVIWNGTAGLVTAYLDGEVTGKTENVSQGYQIPECGFWDIEQDYGGRFTQLQFWNRIISSEEVHQAQTCSSSGNLLSWDSTTMEHARLPKQLGFSGYWRYPCVASLKDCSADHPSSVLQLKNLDESLGPQIIEGKFSTPLPNQTAFSVCAWIYLEEFTEMAPMAVRNSENITVFYLWFSAGGMLTVAMDLYYHKENVSAYNEWLHYCITWSGETGIANLYINGLLVTIVTKLDKGGIIPDGSHLYIHQVQYEEPQDDNPTAGFALKTTEVNWWNYTLTDEAVSDAYICSGSHTGNVISSNGSILEFKDSMPDLFPAPPCKQVVDKIASPYDLKNMTDGTTHLITATLQNVIFEELKEFSYCFNIYKERNDMEPIVFVDKDQNPLITYGYKSVDGGQMYFKIGIEEVVFNDAYFLQNAIYTFCVTWSGLFGELNLYDELGWLGLTASIGLNYSIPANGQLKIFQEQYAGCDVNNPYDGFNYTLSEFYMWDRELSEREVSNFFLCSGSARPFLVAPYFAQWQVEDKPLPAA